MRTMYYIPEPSLCPEDVEPLAVAYCCCCGEPILPYDEYAIIDDEEWCERCLEDMPLSKLIETLGGRWKIASEDDLPDGYDD